MGRPPGRLDQPSLPFVPEAGRNPRQTVARQRENGPQPEHLKRRDDREVWVHRGQQAEQARQPGGLAFDGDGPIRNAVLPAVALSGRLSRAASPGADEREAAAEEVFFVQPGFEPGSLRGGHHARGDQRPRHGSDAQPVELR